jgi:hypothetical protein
MKKPVLMSLTAYQWLQRHRFISEEVIIGIVLYTPRVECRYIDDQHYQLVFKRRKNGKFVEITIWVHERQDSLYVGKLHSAKS